MEPIAETLTCQGCGARTPNPVCVQCGLDNRPREVPPKDERIKETGP